MQLSTHFTISDLYRAERLIFEYNRVSQSTRILCGLVIVTRNYRYNDRVEADGDPALTAAHTALEGVPGPVGLSSAEAHISFLETSDATLATGEDIAKGTSPSRSIQCRPAPG